jgi:hypothetical protein
MTSATPDGSGIGDGIVLGFGCGNAHRLRPRNITGVGNDYANGFGDDGSDCGDGQACRHRPR